MSANSFRDLLQLKSAARLAYLGNLPTTVIKRNLALYLIGTYDPGPNLPPHAPLHVLSHLAQLPPAVLLQVVAGDECWGFLGSDPTSQTGVLYLNADTLVARAYQPGYIATTIPPATRAATHAAGATAYTSCSSSATQVATSSALHDFQIGNNGNVQAVRECHPASSWHSISNSSTSSCPFQLPQAVLATRTGWTRQHLPASLMSPVESNDPSQPLALLPACTRSPAATAPLPPPALAAPAHGHLAQELTAAAARAAAGAARSNTTSYMGPSVSGPVGHPPRNLELVQPTSPSNSSMTVARTANMPTAFMGGGLAAPAAGTASAAHAPAGSEACPVLFVPLSNACTATVLDTKDEPPGEEHNCEVTNCANIQQQHTQAAVDQQALPSPAGDPTSGSYCSAQAQQPTSHKAIYPGHDHIASRSRNPMHAYNNSSNNGTANNGSSSTVCCVDATPSLQLLDTPSPGPQRPPLAPSGESVQHRQQLAAPSNAAAGAVHGNARLVHSPVRCHSNLPLTAAPPVHGNIGTTVAAAGPAAVEHGTTPLRCTASLPADHAADPVLNNNVASVANLMAPALEQHMYSSDGPAEACRSSNWQRVTLNRWGSSCNELEEAAAAVTDAMQGLLSRRTSYSPNSSVASSVHSRSSSNSGAACAKPAHVSRLEAQLPGAHADTESLERFSGATTFTCSSAPAICSLRIANTSIDAALADQINSAGCHTKKANQLCSTKTSTNGRMPQQRSSQTHMLSGTCSTGDDCMNHCLPQIVMDS